METAMNRIRLFASHISHTPLHFIFCDSGVAEKYGFELEVDVARVKQEGRETRDMSDRAPGLLSGEYQFVSGLHDVAHDPKVNFVGPFEPWDTHYLRAIDDSGFIEELQKSQGRT
jgi:hypothetical protein